MPVLQKKALFSAFIICQVLRIIQNYMEVSPAKSLILSATIHGGSYFFIQPEFVNIVNLWNLHCTLFQFVLHSHSKLIQRPMEDQSTGHSEMFDVNAIIFPWDIVLIRTYRNMEMYKSRLLFQYYCLQVLFPSEYLHKNHRISIASMT